MLCFDFFPRSLDDVDVGVHGMSTFRRQMLACLMGWVDVGGGDTTSTSWSCH